MKSALYFSEHPGVCLSRITEKLHYSSIILLVDENTKRLCYSRIKSELPEHDLMEVKSGEETKTLITCESIWNSLTALNADRKSLLVILGGGVLCDMGGFCAATYKRGVDCIYIPTTLLSQVDASIGGKVGVNFLNYKNHIGLFKAPSAIIISTLFLDTLPFRELRSGFAEIVKNSLIYDKSLWNQLRDKRFEDHEWNPLIQASIRIKKEITEQDPYENDVRKTLNFGHTIGHAVESFFIGQGEKLLHGEAVALGMIAESFIAFKKNNLSENELNEITHFLLSVFGKVVLPSADRIVQLMTHDKKNKNCQLLFALIKGIGAATWNNPVSYEDVLQSFRYYNSLDPSPHRGDFLPTVEQPMKSV